MPKSISIYLPDKLVEKMDELPEVNWSEIARQSIEDYISQRKRYDDMGLQIKGCLKEAEYLIHRLKSSLEERNSRSIQTVRSGQINSESSALRFWSKTQELDFLFRLRNSSEDNMILDRILYEIILRDRKGSIIEAIKGVNVGRRIVIPSGEKRITAEPLRASKATLDKLNQMVSTKESDLEWEISGIVYFDSKKGVVEAMIEENGKSIHIN